MDYSAKYNDGFSLIELLVVLSIIALISGLGVTVYFSYVSSNSAEISVNSIVESLRHAQSNAQQIQNDTKWGTKITPTRIITFSGDSYATRNQSSDQFLTLPSGLTITGETEFVFEKVTATTQNTGTITVSGPGFSKEINVNERGTITY